MNFYNHNTFLSSRISSGFNCSGLISSALNNDTFLYNTVTRSASSSSKQDLVNVAEPVVENFSESSSDDSTNSNSISYKDVISLENLKKALKRTKSNSAPGLDGDVKAN
jgi:hypothetical protein